MLGHEYAGAYRQHNGATRYDGVEHRHVPYPLADMYHMMGRATSQCILMCDDSRKDFYKTFLFKPLPVESHLGDASISDFFNAEIVARIITTQQEAVDWLTWTFYYRRLRANPNYYNMLGASNEHVSEHLCSSSRIRLRFRRRAAAFQWKRTSLSL